MSSSVQQRGAKFVSGTTPSGRLRLKREDGSVNLTPVWLTKGTVTDNGDGTVTLTLPEG